MLISVFINYQILEINGWRPMIGDGSLGPVYGMISS
jgi:hypothetical protein